MTVIEQDERATTTGTRLTVHLVVALAAVAFVLMTARWLTTPWDDWVPLTPHQALPAEIQVGDLPKGAHYRCSAVVESSAVTATHQAAAALKYQDLTREPCVGFRKQRIVLGGLDIAVGATMLIGVVVTRRLASLARSHRNGSREVLL